MSPSSPILGLHGTTKAHFVVGHSTNNSLSGNGRCIDSHVALIPPCITIIIWLVGALVDAAYRRLPRERLHDAHLPTIIGRRGDIECHYHSLEGV